MTKFNYNEPEFKVVKMASQDVLTGSLDVVTDAWDTGSGTNSYGGGVDLDDLFSL